MDKEALLAFVDILKSIGSKIFELITAAIWGLYMIISTFLHWLFSLFKVNINIPMLPSRTKILHQGFVSGTLFIIIILYILIINISAFNLFRKDKIKAMKAPPKEENPVMRKRKYDRISERKLLFRCFIGGALGGFLGMKICRHKTLKPKFTIGITVMLAFQLLIFSFIIGFFGFWLYLS